MATIVLDSDNYICTYDDVIEIKADSLEAAIEKAKIYYKNEYCKSIKDEEMDFMDIMDNYDIIDIFVSQHVKKIPCVISVLQ